MSNLFWKNKKVLVTGHTGFKGSWLCMWLTKLGADVTGYALNPPTAPSLFEMCNLNDHMNSIIGDIRDRDLLIKTVENVKPEIIFHLAAQPLVRASYQNPVYTYETNVLGTVNLFDAVRNCDSVKAIVNITTDKCYENKESFWGYREDDRLGGYDPYSSSKACSEIVTESFKNSFFNTEDYEKHGVAIATARAGNVIGGGDFAADRLIPDCIAALMKVEKIIIRNPYAVRPWQHVLEPLSGYMSLAEKLYIEGVKYSGAWNFGPNEENAKDVAYIVNKLCSLWENRILQQLYLASSTKAEAAATSLVDSVEGWYEIDGNAHPHETSYLKLDSYKAKGLLGYRPKWHIDKALEMVVEWTQRYMYNNDSLYNVCISQIQEYESK